MKLYVGNLTWWTTDKDLEDAVSSIGVQDLMEARFHENRSHEKLILDALVNGIFDSFFSELMGNQKGFVW